MYSGDGAEARCAPPLPAISNLPLSVSLGLVDLKFLQMFLVTEYGVCENLRKLEITGVSCRDVYAKRE